jgi:hypothetical protein
MSRPWLLAVGMLVGAALAVYFIVRLPESREPTADAVAWVSDRPISRASYESALQAVASDRKGGTLRADDRERVLERLIDQELLIDRAIELGLHERDPQIRNQLVTAMIDFLVRRAEDEAAAVSETELRAFYQTEGFRFARRPQYRVAVEGAAVPLPAGWLLDKEIEQRLGPSAARKVAELAIGESASIGDGPSQYTIRLLDRQEAEQVPFEEAREAVEAAYARERSEAAVREFLELARKHTDIRIEVER